MLRVLFVCSANQWRSPTAERVFSRHPRLQVRSAGTAARARRRVSAGDLQWAELVMVMEPKHADRLRASFPRLCQHLAIEVLDIPDDYRAMDPALIEVLETAVPGILERYLEDKSEPPE